MSPKCTTPMLQQVTSHWEGLNTNSLAKICHWIRCILHVHNHKTRQMYWANPVNLNAEFVLHWNSNYVPNFHHHNKSLNQLRTANIIKTNFILYKLPSLWFYRYGKSYSNKECSFTCCALLTAGNNHCSIKASMVCVTMFFTSHAEPLHKLVIINVD